MAREWLYIIKGEGRLSKKVIFWSREKNERLVRKGREREREREGQKSLK